MSKFKVIGGTVAGVVLVGGIILGAMSVTVIEAGYAGVVYNRSGGIEEKALGQGWQLVNPLQRVTEYPVSTNTINYEDVLVGTSDGKPIKTTFSYNYHIDVNDLPKIFSKFKGQDSETLEQGFLKQRLTEAAKNVTTKYSVLDVMGNKSQEISLAIQKGFAADVKDIGFIIESVTFTPPKPDEQTAKSIQAKVDAQQKLEQQKVELEKQKIIADTQRVQAQGNADAAVIEAQGKADANTKLQQSVTDKLLELKKIEVQLELAKNQNLPRVVGGNGSILNIPAEMFNGKATK
jgi:regulator of protease activity HflC (stomatin/prohibitin superfamily)